MGIKQGNDASALAAGKLLLQGLEERIAGGHVLMSAPVRVNPAHVGPANLVSRVLDRDADRALIEFLQGVDEAEDVLLALQLGDFAPAGIVVGLGAGVEEVDGAVGLGMPWCSSPIGTRTA